VRKHVLLYGLLGGVLIAGLKLIEYRWLVADYSVEIYGGLVAAVCGLLIMLVASACYVATWEVVYYELAPDFMDKYSAYTIEKARKSGATEAQVAEKTQQMAQFKELYKNPVVNIALTLPEPLPVGIVFTLVTAGVLSRKRRDTGPAMA
jgi:hypothetical protein